MARGIRLNGMDIQHYLKAVGLADIEYIFPDLKAVQAVELGVIGMVVVGLRVLVVLPLEEELRGDGHPDEVETVVSDGLQGALEITVPHPVEKVRSGVISEPGKAREPYLVAVLIHDLVPVRGEPVVTCHGSRVRKIRGGGRGLIYLILGVIAVVVAVAVVTAVSICRRSARSLYGDKACGGYVASFHLDTDSAVKGPGVGTRSRDSRYDPVAVHGIGVKSPAGGGGYASRELHGDGYGLVAVASRQGQGDLSPGLPGIDVVHACRCICKNCFIRYKESCRGKNRDSRKYYRSDLFKLHKEASGIIIS